MVYTGIFLWYTGFKGGDIVEYTPVYPEGVAREAYEAALGKCVMEGGWLCNQSELDVWDERVCGFELI